MLERLVTDAGGVYAFCDTDSMAIVARKAGRTVHCDTATSKVVRALTHDEVRAILARFDGLVPYDPNLVPTFWKFEHASMDRPLFCYAISAKRYALYRKREGRPDLIAVSDRPEQAGFDDIDWDASADDGLADWSEHGLGMYLDPSTPEDPRRDARGRRLWIKRAWEWVLAGDPTVPLPDGSDRLALTRFGLSSPKIAEWFRGYDDAVEPGDRMRPGTFGLIAHPIGMTAALAEGALPTATYHSDPDVWPILPWYDRSTGEAVTLTTIDPGAHPDRFAAELEAGVVRVLTLGDVISRYSRKVEHKSRASDGDEITGETAGLLQRRPVESAAVLSDLTGKEGNKIVERLSGEVTNPEEYRTEYGERADRWSLLVVPVLREMGAANVAELTGISRRAVERALRLEVPSMPHISKRGIYLRVASGRLTHQSPAPADLAPGIYASLHCFHSGLRIQEPIREVKTRAER
jgi:hypothetical protein